MNLAKAPSKNLQSRRRDLTREQFARKPGISRPTLTCLENGAQSTTIKTLHQIATSLKVDVGERFR